MADILFKEESFKVIGACFEVHNDKGSGFVEPVYLECLELELDLQSIPFTAQHELKLNYKGRQLTQIYKPDGRGNSLSPGSHACFHEKSPHIQCFQALVTDKDR